MSLIPNPANDPALELLNLALWLFVIAMFLTWTIFPFVVMSRLKSLVREAKKTNEHLDYANDQRRRAMSGH